VWGSGKKKKQQKDEVKAHGGMKEKCPKGMLSRGKGMQRGGGTTQGSDCQVSESIQAATAPRRSCVTDETPLDPDRQYRRSTRAPLKLCTHRTILWIHLPTATTVPARTAAEPATTSRQATTIELNLDLEGCTDISERVRFLGLRAAEALRRRSERLEQHHPAASAASITSKLGVYYSLRQGLLLFRLVTGTINSRSNASVLAAVLTAGTETS
jgi:hypothetical protein